MNEIAGEPLVADDVNILKIEVWSCISAPYLAFYSEPGFVLAEGRWFSPGRQHLVQPLRLQRSAYATYPASVSGSITAGATAQTTQFSGVGSDIPARSAYPQTVLGSIAMTFSATAPVQRRSVVDQADPANYRRYPDTDCLYFIHTVSNDHATGYSIIRVRTPARLALQTVRY